MAWQWHLPRLPEHCCRANANSEIPPAWVDFDRGEVLHRGPQQIGCEIVARSKLKNVRPQVGAGEDPRHALLDGFSPSVRTA